MTANQQVEPVTPGSPLYGDTQIVEASNVPLPSLRVLQAAGAIQSQKISKHHGGFRRMWPETEVLKAAIASALSEHFAWNIRVVSEAMAKVHASTWDTLITTALWNEDWQDKTIITASNFDCFVELIDRKFLFLQVPAITLALLPDVEWCQPNLLLGIVKKDGLVMLPWAFGSPQGRAQMKKALGNKQYQKAERHYKLAMAAHGNFLSKATVNVSMQVRSAWHRLHGHKAFFIQETVQLGKGDSEQ